MSLLSSMGSLLGSGLQFPSSIASVFSRHSSIQHSWRAGQFARPATALRATPPVPVNPRPGRVRSRDRQDWQLCPEEAAKYAAQFGGFQTALCQASPGDPTWQATQSRLRQSCTGEWAPRPDVMTFSDFQRHSEVAGDNFWVCAPFHSAGSLLRRYLTHRQHVNSTSDDTHPMMESIFLVPKLTKKPWWPLTHNFQIIHEYPASTPGLFQVPPSQPGGAWQDMGPLKWPVVVLRDSPLRFRSASAGRGFGPTFEPTQVSITATSTQGRYFERIGIPCAPAASPLPCPGLDPIASTVIKLRVSVRGQRLVALIDSGATTTLTPSGPRSCHSPPPLYQASPSSLPTACCKMLHSVFLHCLFALVPSRTPSHLLSTTWQWMIWCWGSLG